MYSGWVYCGRVVSYRGVAVDRRMVSLDGRRSPFVGGQRDGKDGEEHRGRESPRAG